MKKKTGLTIYIIALSSQGPGLSGGDRIYIEWARRWAKGGQRINLLVWEEGYKMCQRKRLGGVNYILSSAMRCKRFGPVVLYLARTIKGCSLALRIKPNKDSKEMVIYSSSDFWMDSLPGWIMKKRFPAAKWIASFYLFAPHPLKGFRRTYKKGIGLPGGKELIYFLLQKPIYWMVKRSADMVFVTSEPDRDKFISKRLPPERVIAVRGGVDTKISKQVPEPGEKKYDAVFIGRFHPQKGVLELVDIWRDVCRMEKDAKLAMIGDGSLEEEVKKKIKRMGLEKNIELLGFMDGVEKIKVFKSSRVVLHPAVYDSGGMAACEAMACGLPGVSFNLPALKTYYPRGMLKAPINDLGAFAQNIIRLLNDEELYQKMSKEALSLAREEWDWDKRAALIYSKIIQK